MTAFNVVRFKIKPGRDYEMIRTLRREYPSITMSVDANSAYTLDDADLMKKFDEFNLLMIEQPLSYDDIIDHASFTRRVPTVSFSHPRLVPADMANFLDAHGVYVWNGHSYGNDVIERLGLQDRGGVLRIGPTHYNTVDELDTALTLIEDFVRGRVRSDR